MHRRISKRFATQTSAGSDDALTIEVEESATIEKLKIRIYIGAELDLELDPFVLRDGSERTSIPDLIGKDVIVGDDDTFTLDVSEPVREGDVIGVDYNNTDQNNPHSFAVDMTLERSGGTNRLLHAIRGLV